MHCVRAVGIASQPVHRSYTVRCAHHGLYDEPCAGSYRGSFDHAVLGLDVAVAKAVFVYVCNAAMQGIVAEALLYL